MSKARSANSRALALVCTHMGWHASASCGVAHGGAGVGGERRGEDGAVRALARLDQIACKPRALVRSRPSVHLPRVLHTLAVVWTSMHACIEVRTWTAGACRKRARRSCGGADARGAR